MSSSYQALAVKTAGKNHACPVCGTNNWTIPQESQRFVIQVIENGNIPVGAGLPVLPLICNKCSYVRMHADNGA